MPDEYYKAVKGIYSYTYMMSTYELRVTQSTYMWAKILAQN